MPGNLLTPVTIRRRSAAQGCANAHLDRRPPEGRWVRQAEIGYGRDTGAAGIDELIKWVKLPCKKENNTNELSTNQPVQAEYDSQLVASSTGSIHHDMSHRRP